MKIDFSAWKLWHECPLKYYERYEAPNAEGALGIEAVERDDSMLFGSRSHELLEEYYSNKEKYPPLPDEALEAEAQAMFAGYVAHYPCEDFGVVATEQVLELPLPRFRSQAQHTLVVKLDMVVNYPNILEVFETKTERRGSYSNSNEAWAARFQVSGYLWAARMLYQEPVRCVLLNVITRQSEKGRVSADFRRERLYRTGDQIQEALENFEYVADQIEAMRRTGFWPADRERCKFGSRKCDYYPLHIFGRTEANLALYKPAEHYLEVK